LDSPVIRPWRRDVADVRGAVERQQMVLAAGGELDVADEHELVVVGLDAGW
jgi:hypothetical protein